MEVRLLWIQVFALSCIVWSTQGLPLPQTRDQIVTDTKVTKISRRQKTSDCHGNGSVQPCKSSADKHILPLSDQQRFSDFLNSIKTHRNSRYIRTVSLVRWHQRQKSRSANRKKKKEEIGTDNQLVKINIPSQSSRPEMKRTQNSKLGDPPTIFLNENTPIHVAEKHQNSYKRQHVFNFLRKHKPTTDITTDDPSVDSNAVSQNSLVTPVSQSRLNKGTHLNDNMSDTVLKSTHKIYNDRPPTTTTTRTTISPLNPTQSTLPKPKRIVINGASDLNKIIYMKRTLKQTQDVHRDPETTSITRTSSVSTVSGLGTTSEALNHNNFTAITVTSTVHSDLAKEYTTTAATSISNVSVSSVSTNDTFNTERDNHKRLGHTHRANVTLTSTNRPTAEVGSVKVHHIADAKEETTKPEVNNLNFKHVNNPMHTEDQVLRLRGIYVLFANSKPPPETTMPTIKLKTGFPGRVGALDNLSRKLVAKGFDEANQHETSIPKGRKSNQDDGESLNTKKGVGMSDYTGTAVIKNGHLYLVIYPPAADNGLATVEQPPLKDDENNKTNAVLNSEKNSTADVHTAEGHIQSTADGMSDDKQPTKQRTNVPTNDVAESSTLGIAVAGSHGEKPTHSDASVNGTVEFNPENKTSADIHDQGGPTSLHKPVHGDIHERHMADRTSASVNNSTESLAHVYHTKSTTDPSITTTAKIDKSAEIIDASTPGQTLDKSSSMNYVTTTELHTDHSRSPSTLPRNIPLSKQKVLDVQSEHPMHETVAKHERNGDHHPKPALHIKENMIQKDHMPDKHTLSLHDHADHSNGHSDKDVESSKENVNDFLITPVPRYMSPWSAIDLTVVVPAPTPENNIKLVGDGGVKLVPFLAKANDPFQSLKTVISTLSTQVTNQSTSSLHPEEITPQDVANGASFNFQLEMDKNSNVFDLKNELHNTVSAPSTDAPHKKTVPGSKNCVKEKRKSSSQQQRGREKEKDLSIHAHVKDHNRFNKNDTDLQTASTPSPSTASYQTETSSAVLTTNSIATVSTTLPVQTGHNLRTSTQSTSASPSNNMSEAVTESLLTVDKTTTREMGLYSSVARNAETSTTYFPTDTTIMTRTTSRSYDTSTTVKHLGGVPTDINTPPSISSDRVSGHFMGDYLVNKVNISAQQHDVHSKAASKNDDSIKNPRTTVEGQKNENIAILNNRSGTEMQKSVNILQGLLSAEIAKLNQKSNSNPIFSSKVKKTLQHSKTPEPTSSLSNSHNSANPSPNVHVPTVSQAVKQQGTGNMHLHGGMRAANDALNVMLILSVEDLISDSPGLHGALVMQSSEMLDSIFGTDTSQ